MSSSSTPEEGARIAIEEVEEAEAILTSGRRRWRGRSARAGAADA